MSNLASRSEMRAQLAAKAEADDDFRAQLLADPKGTLAQKTGISLPESVQVKVVEDTATLFHIVVPPASQYELSDEDLEMAAGGDFTWRHAG